MPPGAARRDGLLPGLGRARRLDHRLVAAVRALAAAEQLGGRAACLAGEREQAAERPAAEHGDVLTGLHARVVGAVHRAGERLDRRCDLVRNAIRHAVQVDPRDALRHAQQLRVGAVEQRVEIRAQLLAARRAGVAGAAGRRVDAAHGIALAERRVLTAGHDDARVLVPEGRRRGAQQHGMAAAVALGVGRAGQRGLDAQHDLAGARLGLGDVLDAHVARRPVARGDHGANTTLSASRLR